MVAFAHRHHGYPAMRSNEEKGDRKPPLLRGDRSADRRPRIRKPIDPQGGDTMTLDRLTTPIRASGFRAVLAAACFGMCGMAFAGDRPALIDGAVADAPDARPVLGEAEQGRWLATIHPQALALDSAQQVRGTDNSTDPTVRSRFEEPTTRPILPWVSALRLTYLNAVG
jgi:hypothetical protein